MIKFNDIFLDLTDPLSINDWESVYKMQVESEFLNGKFRFEIPEHIEENKEKKEYKTGFLNEVYSIFNPKKLKREVFEYVTKQFDIFVDERQYQNTIKQYQKKKYSVFIKN